MHAADRIGLYREGQILVYTGVGPPDKTGIGFITFVRLLTVISPQPPTSVVIPLDGCLTGPPRSGIALLEAPPTHVVTGRHYPRADPLGSPRLDDEVARPRRDTN